MKLRKQKFIALFLAVFLVLGAVGTQAFAWDAPTGEGATVGFEPEDVRIDNKTTHQQVTLKGKFDSTVYDRLQNLALVLTISDPDATLDTAGTTYNPANGKISITGPNGLVDRVFTLNNITETVTITPSQNPDTTSNAIPKGGSAINKVSIGDKITFKTAKIIVQQPVTVNIIGTVPSGAAVSAKLTEYSADDPGKTYNPDGTATPITSGDTIWVDTGLGANNAPNLDITIPNGYVAEWYRVDTPATGSATEDKTQYATAGAEQTIRAVESPTTVFVRFMKEFTLTFDPNGGTPTPVAVKKYETDPNYTIEQTVTKDNMKFDGWYNGDTKVTSWDTNSDLTVKAKFSPLPGVDVPSTYKFVITAPETLQTNQSYTAAKVQLAADQVYQLGYPNAKLKVEMTAMPTGSNPVVTAPVFGNLVGLTTPLAVTKDFTFELPISELKADKAGTYTMKVSLLDAADGDAVICEATHTIVVSDGQINNSSLVEFDAQGGTPAPEDQTVVNGGKATKPTDPTKEGYTFNGWFLPDGTKYDFDKAVTEDVKLTAQYTATSGAGKTDSTGSKTTTPSTEKTDANGPKTGDNSNMGIWIAVLAASVLGVSGLGFYGFISKKKNHEAK